jgi:hypothetical protein
MPEILAALVAFVAEHQRCGDLDGGRDNGYIWLQCSCGGLIMQPEKEPPNQRPELKRAKRLSKKGGGRLANRGQP